MKKIIVILILNLFVNVMFAQNWNLPNSRKNTRFTTDFFDLPRPALSLRGFDNTNLGSYSNPQSDQIKGVRQFIEDIYNISSDHNNEAAIQRHINIANSYNYTSGDDFDINSDAAILESKALLALVSYIIDNNDGPNGILHDKSSTLANQIQDHNFYLTRLMADFRSRRIFVKGHSLGSAFKIGTSLTRLARAWDLYLALENAYEDLGGNTSLLLSSSDKHYWNNHIISETEYMKSRVSSNFDQDITQAGNWPLIAWISIATVSYGFNGYDEFLQTNGDVSSDAPLNDLETARVRTSLYYDSNKGTVRKHNWYYQTGDGKAYFAEGPYYLEVLLPPLLNFLHIYKSNDLGRKGFSIGTPNPHSDSRLLNALEWHCDIATNDGNTPPLDDGNLKEILSSRLMNWSVEYGEPIVGKKYAFLKGLDAVRDKLESVDFYGSRLVEISFNHVDEALAIPHSDYYGNNNTGQSPHINQTVIRRKDSDGTQHYILMNGEKGPSITSGEGHEQNDQMQILYYVKKPNQEEHSYLMDSGYDKGSGDKNSTWNRYDLHNVMYTGYNFGAPFIHLSELRKAVDQPNVDYLYWQRPSSKLDIIRGKGSLRHVDSIGRYINNSKYQRDVIIVNEDPNRGTKTYIVDTNQDYFTIPIQMDQRSFLDFGINYYVDFQETEFEGSYKPSRDSYSKIGNVNPFWIYMDIIEVVMPQEGYNYENGIKLREMNGRDLNPGDKDGYLCSRIGMQRNLAHINGQDTWSSVSFLNALSTTRPSRPLNQFNYTQGARDYQVWAQEHTSNVVDIVISRTKTTNPVEIVLDNYDDYKIALKENQRNGFVRLIRQNNQWVHDPDYVYNVHVTKTFSGNQTITENTTFYNDVVIDGEEDRLTIDGATVIFEPGTVVKFRGEQMIISVINGGKIIADGVTFIDEGNGTKGIGISSNYSSFKNCTFDGFSYALNLNNQYTTIENCTFKNNYYGILAYHNTNIHLKKCSFEDNYYGVYTYGDLFLDGVDYMNYSANVFKDNTYGIATFNGDVSLNNAAFNSNTTALYPRFSSNLYFGTYEIANKFYSNNKVVKNGTYSSIYATLQYYQWSNPPAYSEQVYYSPAISLDPTNYSNTQLLCDMGGSRLKSAVCDGNLYSKMAVNATSSDSIEVDVDKLIRVALQTLELTDIKDLSNKELSNSLMTLLRYKDKVSLDQLEQFKTFLRKAWNSPAKLVTNSFKSSAAQIYIKMLLLEESYDEALTLTLRFQKDARFKQQTANYVSLEFDVYMLTNQWSNALEAIERLEALELNSSATEQLTISKKHQSKFEEIIGKNVHDELRNHVNELASQSEDLSIMILKSSDRELTSDPIETSVDIYPNPFNPITTVRFTLETDQNVSIDVYNIMGQLIQELTNSTYTAGTHTISFDGSNLSTGIYFIKSRIGVQTFTQKITLSK